MTMPRDETACPYCFGWGRDREGSRCQDCGGNGLAPGVQGFCHPRFFSVRLGTLCTGWQSASFPELSDKIEACAAFTKEAGFKLEQFNELDRRRMRMMIERQVLLGIELGHFESLGIGKESLDAIKADLEKNRDEDLFGPRKGKPIG